MAALDVRVQRDHDEFQIDSAYWFDERGNVAVWSHADPGNFAFVGEIARENTDTLSVLWLNPHSWSRAPCPDDHSQRTLTGIVSVSPAEYW